MEIKSALDQSCSDARPDDPVGRGFTPTLAIVFISVKQDRSSIINILKDANIDIVGATSSGEFINDHQSDGEIVLLLMNIKREYYSIVFSDTKGQDVVQAAKQATSFAFSKFSNPAFIICSTGFSAAGDMYEGQLLIHTIYENAGKRVPIFGGMAGDDGTLTGTYVFSADECSDEGFVMLVLDHDSIELNGMAISGWKPAGKVRTVTRTVDGWMHTIDDQPALEMYLRYLGQSLKTGKTDAEKVNFLEDIAIFYPFQAFDAGEPVLRTPIEVNRGDNSIKLDIAIPQGKQFQFTLPPDFDIVETVLDNAASLKDENNLEADALLIFSCFGRRSALGPMVEEENNGLHKIWNAPMVGFYSYGEYGKDVNSDHTFHSTTCSWVALKEK